jgi:hypothetical protein
MPSPDPFTAAMRSVVAAEAAVLDALNDLVFAWRAAARAVPAAFRAAWEFQVAAREAHRMVRRARDHGRHHW